jgi:hypothetical protein
MSENVRQENFKKISLQSECSLTTIFANQAAFASVD